MPLRNSEDELDTEVKVAELDREAIEAPREGKPSAFSCPHCHGVLWEIEEGRLVRFRCRVGHAFSPESLLASQSDNLEEALWVALRTLEESAAIADRLYARATGRGHSLSASRFAEQAADARRRAEVIRQALTGGQIIAQSGAPVIEENERSKPFAPQTSPSGESSDHSWLKWQMPLPKIF